MAHESYDLILGVSAGAINGVFAAAGRLDAAAPELGPWRRR